MPWGAAIGALGSVAGAGISALGGKGSVSNQTSKDPLQLTQETYSTDVLGKALQSTPGSYLVGSYPGQLGVSLSPLQQAMLASLMGAGQGSAAPAAQAGGAQTAALDTLTNVAGSSPNDFQPYFKSNVEQPATQTFNETTLPGIVSALGGNLGGPRSTAAVQGVAKAGQDFNNTLMASRDNLALQALQQNQANKLQAAQMTPAVAASPLTTLLETLQAGAVPTTLAQSNQAAQYTDYSNQIANMLKVLGLSAGQQGINTTNTIVQQPNSNAFAGLNSPSFGTNLSTLFNSLSGNSGGTDTGTWAV